MNRRTGILCLLLLLLAGTAYAQDRLERDPGYVDFGSLNASFSGEPTLEVNVKGGLLKLVAEASRFEDPELASLLRKLKAIQVRGFRVDGAQFDGAARQATSIARKLESRGWDTVIRVREYNEHVDMYVKVVDDAIAGLVVMVVGNGDDDTIFLNIVGEIDPEEVGRIGRKFNIGKLNDW